MKLSKETEKYAFLLSIIVMFKILSLEKGLSQVMDSHAFLEKLIKSHFFSG